MNFIFFKMIFFFFLFLIMINNILEIVNILMYNLYINNKLKYITNIKNLINIKKYNKIKKKL